MKILPGAKKSPKAGKSASFHMSTREREALLAVLESYPMVEPGHHQLTRAQDEASAADQDLLRETVTASQKEHRKRLEQLFADDHRFFHNTGDGVLLTLTGEQMEWLLRVLNDVRVGSWIKLGCPDIDSARRVKPAPGKTRLWATMDLCAYFQSAILEAFA